MSTSVSQDTHTLLLLTSTDTHYSRFAGPKMVLHYGGELCIARIDISRAIDSSDPCSRSQT